MPTINFVDYVVELKKKQINGVIKFEDQNISNGNVCLKVRGSLNEFCTLYRNWFGLSNG